MPSTLKPHVTGHRGLEEGAGVNEGVGLGERCFCLWMTGEGEGIGSFSPGEVNASNSSAAVQVRAETIPLTAFPSREVNPS